MMNDDDTPDAATPEEAAAPPDADTDIETLRKELADWRDKALRAAAEAENTRRRAERENNDAKAYAIQRFSRDLFEAADNLERALLAAPREDVDPAVKNFVLGIEMTGKALQSAFERNGLKRIDPGKGAKFDPHLHQAMMEQPDPETEPGTIVQTMQTGYELFGRVVRPAMVIVAAKRADAPAKGEEDPSGGKAYAKANGAGAGGTVDTKA
jgi:molecular chaperone GrpE